MRDFSASGVDQPLRSIVEIGQDGVLALMPGMLEAPSGFGAKLISVWGDPRCPGRSAHSGVVVLFDRTTGIPVCIADAGEITEIRTAAASAVATAVLAPEEATRLAVFGAGAQAWSHIQALARIRPLSEIAVWSRTAAAAEALAARARETIGVPVQATSDPRAAAERAQIICTVTAASEPILFGDWVQPGTHVNLVGSSFAGPREADHALVIKARFIADSRRSVLAAGAEFLSAKAAGLVGDDHIAAEIGEVLLGRVPGRRAAEEITVYKSLGHIVQDLAAAAYVHERSRAGRSRHPFSEE